MFVITEKIMKRPVYDIPFVSDTKRSKNSNYQTNTITVVLDWKLKTSYA